MSTTEPIRDRRELERFKDYYRTVEPNPRNYTLIMLGLHTALRISDILHLTVDMVYHGKRAREHIDLIERKTGKKNRVCLNAEIRMILQEYLPILKKNKMHQAGNPYLFPSSRGTDIPLSRSQAYRMIRAAAEELDMGEHISCHSLRKTFGYLAWKQNQDPVVIMLIYNHSSFSITRHYLCLEQDDKDYLYNHIRI